MGRRRLHTTSPPDGSAKDLGAAVDFYNDRFHIGFTKQERADLVAFLNSR